MTLDSFRNSYGVFLKYVVLTIWKGESILAKEKNYLDIRNG